MNQETIQILHNVSFEVGEQEVIAIIGETGCGKSVTGSTILRILPENAVVSGEILYKGNELLSMPEEMFRNMRGSEIASIPQSPSTSLDPLMRVGEQVANVSRTGNRVSQIEKRNLSKRVKEIFDKLKLPREDEMYDRYPCELSGGMKQRVLLSMGIITTPKLLVVDEPTKAIDWSLRKNVVEQMKRLKDEMKCSMIFITHDLGAAKMIAVVSAVMYCGRDCRDRYGRRCVVSCKASIHKGTDCFYAVKRDEGDEGIYAVLCRKTAALQIYAEMPGGDRTLCQNPTGDR